MNTAWANRCLSIVLIIESGLQTGLISLGWSFETITALLQQRYQSPRCFVKLTVRCLRSSRVRKFIWQKINSVNPFRNPVFCGKCSSWNPETPMSTKSKKRLVSEMRTRHLASLSSDQTQIWSLYVPLAHVSYCSQSAQDQMTPWAFLQSQTRLCCQRRECR